MKNFFPGISTIILLLILIVPKSSNCQKTFCNPLNLSYRFALDTPSRRTAADPVIVLFKDNYYLFATASGGYWHSTNLLDWILVTTGDLPFEKDAPAAAVINGSLYYMPMSSHTIYKASDPLNGKWEVYTDSFPLAVGDPDFYQDVDGKVYLYFGCTNNDYLQGVELDPQKKLSPIGKPVAILKADTFVRGWERSGDYNTGTEAPWTEGPWMTKHGGKYYYQYSAPGTQYKSYADGYFVADHPLGPFIYSPTSPFSAKPEGFIDGAGHASTFTDKFGNYWRVITMVISVKHIFERRLGLIPVTFDSNQMIAHTEFADYPVIMPDHKTKDIREVFPRWMILSYNRPAIASSSLPNHMPSSAVNEEIRDYWSAKTGNKGEWLKVDLGQIKTVNAIQLNFAENDTHLFGRDGILPQQYVLDCSNDNKNWKIIIDQSKNQADLTHQYHSFKPPVKARFFRVINYRVPAGTFAISGFRIFGSGNTKKPTKVTNFKATRDDMDPRKVTLLWKKQNHAIGYNIRFGINKHTLNRVYQVYSDTTLTIRSLNRDQEYWFAIDSFGENGITPGIIHPIGNQK